MQGFGLYNFKGQVAQTYHKGNQKLQPTGKPNWVHLPKVTQLGLSSFSNENILRLHITMKNPSGMQVEKCRH